MSCHSSQIEYLERNILHYLLCYIRRSIRYRNSNLILRNEIEAVQTLSDTVPSHFEHFVMSQTMSDASIFTIISN